MSGNLRGMAFAQFVGESLLAKRLIHDHDFIVELGSEEAEKDYGDGAIAYFDCGQAVFMRDHRTILIHQSRLSDSWNIADSTIGWLDKPQLMQGLKDRDKLNDENFVADLLLVLNLERRPNAATK